MSAAIIAVAIVIFGAQVENGLIHIAKAIRKVPP